MKNLPERDFWNAIRNRLLQYKEEPGDDWDKIAGAIPSSNRDHRGFSKASDLTTLALLAFLSGFVVGDLRTDKTMADKLAGKIILPESSAGNVEPHVAAEQKSTTTKVLEQTAEDHVSHERLPASSVEKKENSLIRPKVKSTRKHEDRGTANGNQPSVMADVQYIQAKSESSQSVINHIETKKDETELDFNSNEEMILAKKDSIPEIKNVASPAPKENKKTKKKFRPSIYVVASPTLGFYKVIPIKDDQIEIRNLKRKGIFSGDRLGFNLEAGFQSRIGRNLELYVSASYYQNEQTISYTFSDPTQLSIASTNDPLSYTLSPGESTANITFKQKNIGGGLGLMYHIRGRKLMHKIGGGLQFMQGLTRNKDAEGNLLPASRSLNYNLFYRLEYSILPRTSIFLQPSFTRAISPNETLNAPFDVKPYHAGLGIGWLFHF
jgi:hypothetical protein